MRFFIVFEGLSFDEKIKNWQKIADTSFKHMLSISLFLTSSLPLSYKQKKFAQYVEWFFFLKNYKDSKFKLLNFKGAEATCTTSIIVMKKCFRLKDMLYFNIFSAHMNMFWQHCLENKKPIFLIWMPKQVYTVIVEFFKKQYFSKVANPLLLDLWNGCCKSTVRIKRRQGKMEGTS